MLRHIRNVHDKIKIAKCDICKAEFGSEDSKLRHVETIHKNAGKKLWSCPYCEKEFKYKASLGKHFKNHHPGELEVFRISK